jgi:alginate O-acetyltransferase complex protein AlgI
MEIGQVLVLTAIACLFGVLTIRWLRGWLLLVLSIAILFWLQPEIPAIRQLDFALPSIILALAAIGWALTRSEAARLAQDDWIALLVTIGMILTLTLPRYIDIPILSSLTSRPPDTWFVGVVLFLGGIAFALLLHLLSDWRNRMAVFALFLVLVFVITKQDTLTTGLVAFLRVQVGSDPTLASAIDFRWLGFSYVVFRILHTLRDRQTGILPPSSLRQYLTYVVFFPAVVAGPIDRLENHLKHDNLLPAMVGLDPARFYLGLQRIGVGLFKKFVVADTLAVVAMSPANVGLVQSTPAMWILLYAYAFRLFYDFSGYSDIAIGMGILLGFRLPENFDAPYGSRNITQFWQRWHMSLSNWVRFYVFIPLTRSLLKRVSRERNQLIVVTGHMTSMVLIGAWHALTINFVLWGIWQGVGLSIHKLWSDHRPRQVHTERNTLRDRAYLMLSSVGTFHFVALSWVLFSMPDPQTSALVFAKLVGLGW